MLMLMLTNQSAQVWQVCERLQGSIRRWRSMFHNPRSHKTWDVNSRRLVVTQASDTPAGRAMAGCRGGGRFPHQLKGPVVIPVGASFVG